MRCPLLAHKTYIPDDWPMQVYEDCLKEECAWWQSELQNCIVYQIGMEIGTLCLFLEEIKEKMPHAGQFTK